MKIRTFALAAVALAAAAQAQAAVDLTGYTQFYIAGSSALTPVIAGILNTNCAAAATKYVDSTDGKSNFLYTCTLKAGSGLAVAIAGNSTATPNIAVFKRDAGGSIYGVNPVALGTAVDFLNPATINTTTKVGDQTGNQHIVNLGAADVEPAIFTDPLNLPSGFSALTSAQTALLQTDKVLLQTFGVAVNANLYTALQTAQATSGVPTVSSTALQSAVNEGGWQTAAVTWGNILGATDGSTSSTDGSLVTICRRAAGSGTQAGAQILFSPSPLVPLNAATDSDGTFVVVNEGSSTGNVKTCLNNATSGYALGYIGYENKPGSSDTWKFVKLDGYTADIANAKVGAYAYAFENTFNYLKSTAGTTAGKLAAAFTTEALALDASGNSVLLQQTAFTADLKSAVSPVSLTQASRGASSRFPLVVSK